jgi:hypothetical protein
MFFVARPFAAGEEDITETVSRSSNLGVIVAGILVEKGTIAVVVGDWMLVGIVVLTMLIYIVTVGPVRAIRETLAFFTHRWAVAAAATLIEYLIQEMSTKQVSGMTQETWDELSDQQRFWMVQYHPYYLSHLETCNAVVYAVAVGKVENFKNIPQKDAAEISQATFDELDDQSKLWLVRYQAAFLADIAAEALRASQYAVAVGEASSVDEYESWLTAAHAYSTGDAQLTATELTKATRAGDADALRGMMARGADVMAMEHGVSAKTLLYYAASSGEVECVSILLDFGAPIDITDADGCTPLMAAALYGHADVCLQLLEGGAKPFIRGTAVQFRGRSALELAELYNKVDAAAVLNRWFNDHMDFFTPAERAELQVVKRKEK